MAGAAWASSRPGPTTRSTGAPTNTRRKRLVALVHTSKPHVWRDAIPSTSSESGHTAASVLSKVLVSIPQRVIRFGTCPVLTARGC